MLVLADFSDVVLNIGMALMTLVIIAFGIMGLVFIIGGFVQMQAKQYWEGFNVFGKGAFIMLLTFIYLRLTFFDLADGDLKHFHQRSLTAMLFAFIYGGIIAFFNIMGIPWGIIFIVGVAFVMDKMS